jgi:hypothetical protein
MIKSDPYLKMANRQFRDLDAGIAQASSDLEAYRVAGDNQSARAALQQLADLSAQKQNLAALQNHYLQSRQPPPEPTAEERAARPLDRMSWQDGLELARTSKYGAGISENDPNVQAGFAEIQRRRARGE